MILFYLLFIVCARHPARSYISVVSYCEYVTLLIPGTRGTRNKRSCQNQHPVMTCEEALARGWCGVILYKASGGVREWKVRRTIAAAVYDTAIVIGSVLTRHRLHANQPEPAKKK